MASTFVAACSDAQSAAPPPVQRDSASAVPSPDLTGQPAEQPSAQLTDQPSDPPADQPSEQPTDAPTDDSSTAAPVLPSSAAGQALTLSKFFKYPDGWKDGRFDVADRKQVPGISGMVFECGDGSQGATLELRLANNFQTMKLDVGQSNSSPDSDQTLIVRVDANEQYRDLKKTKLNQVASFSLKVDHVNALKIKVTLDRDVENCGYGGGVEAVLMNVLLS